MRKLIQQLQILKQPQKQGHSRAADWPATRFPLTFFLRVPYKVWTP